MGCDPAQKSNLLGRFNRHTSFLKTAVFDYRQQRGIVDKPGWKCWRAFAGLQVGAWLGRMYRWGSI